MGVSRHAKTCINFLTSLDKADSTRFTWEKTK